jgi:hypothetical protein
MDTLTNLNNLVALLQQNAAKIGLTMAGLLVAVYCVGIMLSHDNSPAAQVDTARAPLDGAATTLERLRREDAFEPIWWPFADLVGQQHRGQTGLIQVPSIPLTALFGPPASQDLVERFSQRSTLVHLYTARTSGRPRSGKRPLPSFVGKPLLQRAGSWHGLALTDALRGTRAEQREAVVSLTLHLSTIQKEVLCWLAHHPLLTLHQLSTLLVPRPLHARSLQNHLAELMRLNLVQTLIWHEGTSWGERERYVLAEPALR